MKGKTLLILVIGTLASCSLFKEEYEWGDGEAQKDYARSNGSITFVYKNYDGEVLATRNYLFHLKNTSFYGTLYTEIPHRQPENGYYYKFDGWSVMSDVVNTLKTSYEYKEVYPLFGGTNRESYKAIEIDVIANYKSYTEDDLLSYIKGNGNNYGIQAKQAFDLEEFSIPSTYGEGQVVSLLPKAFCDLKSLKKISVPNSVTAIGDDSFLNDSALKDVSLGNQIAFIGRSAFENCSSLDTISIPDSLETLSNRTFANTSIKEIDLSKTKIRGIPESIFEGDKCLSRVVFSSSTSTIRKNAFKDCLALETLELTSRALLIQGYSFNNAPIKTVSIPSGSSFSIEAHGFDGNKELTNIDTQNALVLTLGTNAFKNCSSLRSVVLPEATTIYGTGIFAGCSKSLNVYYAGSSLSSFPTGYDDQFEGTFYTYLETEPTGFGNFWHYVNGVPTSW